MVCEGTPDTYSNHESGLSRLVDANNAGTEHAGACTLILTEGDSGAAFANAGLGVVGKDYFGVYPLCGKLLNVRDATLNEVQNNQDLLNLRKIMGLQYNKEYTNIYGLRYGRLMIMTNQATHGQKQRDFFTIPEYEKWLEETPGGEEWVLEHFTVGGSDRLCDED
ncbi:hypothetical protein CVT25_005795 [Psilocybe cyanescens]|uniref:DNA topoisomerase (ATP-hydrolyzing) n=1 Tax=Psilocybe cyanescens TaxID=93625 RepID=A0A409VLP4_PSICY|nr:hypothetical protein CVT25_005795 [Psilocybe cyanescens]